MLLRLQRCRSDNRVWYRHDGRRQHIAIPPLAQGTAAVCLAALGDPCARACVLHIGMAAVLGPHATHAFAALNVITTPTIATIATTNNLMSPLLNICALPCAIVATPSAASVGGCLACKRARVRLRAAPARPPVSLPARCIRFRELVITFHPAAVCALRPDMPT